jgi:DNA-binding MarR family transcriptional regulator
MGDASSDWNFFSNYAHVLICLAENPDTRLRDVAGRVGITERSALRLVTQLEQDGILLRVKEGRRNSYVIEPNEQLRHPIEAHCTVGELLETILSPADFASLARRFMSKKTRSRQLTTV